VTDPVVVDASAVVDLLVGGPAASWVTDRIGERHLHAPGHFPAEVLTAIHGMVRRGQPLLEPAEVILNRAATLPIELADVRTLLVDTWRRRDQHALADALYVELAAQLDTVVVTTNRRLARATSLAAAPPG
jgi:predicted nucleic acid-binding protein